MSIINSAEKLSFNLSKWFGYLAYFALIGAFVLVVISVIMRYFLNVPLAYTEELGGSLNIIIIFAIMSQLFLQGKHLRVSVIADRLPAKYQSVLEILGTFLAISFISVLAWHVMKIMIDVYSIDVRYSTLRMFPIWPVYGVMVVGLVIFDVSMCIHLVKLLILLLRVEKRFEVRG